MGSFRLTLPDYLIVGGYFILVLWIGFHFRKHLVGARDYFAGGHQVPWWLAGISHYMSSFSAFSFVAYSQLGYTYGWVAITLFWVTLPACLLGGLVFARRWRRARIITPVEFLEDRFNAFIRQLFAWAGIPLKVFDNALRLFATGLFVSLGIGMNLHWAIVLCGAVSLVYTLLGGLWALIVTDYVQFIMKALAMLLLLPLALWAAGGLRPAFSNLPPHFFRLTGGPYGWTYLIGFVALIAISYNSTWSLAQKYYSVPDDRAASKAAYLAAVLNFVGAPLMILPAIVGRKLLPDLLAQHRTADVYVLLVLKLLPVGMIGIIVAAIFSATMAAVSADFNALASVLTKDVYHRLLNPGANEGKLVKVGRLTTLMLGGLTIILSLWIAITRQESLFHTMVTVFGLLVAPTFLPLLAGLTIRRITWKGAFAGFIGGLTTGVLTLALKSWYLPHIPGISREWVTFTFEGISILINVGVTIVMMWLGSVWLSTTQEDKERMRSFFLALDRPITVGETASTARVSPKRAIGISTTGVGALLGAAGFFSGSFVARVVDLSIGFGLVILGAVFYFRGREIAVGSLPLAAGEPRQ